MMNSIPDGEAFDSVESVFLTHISLFVVLMHQEIIFY